MRMCRSCCSGNATLTVQGCANLALAGAGVTITLGGSTVFSGTTNGSGQIGVALQPSTTYTLVVTSSRFTTLNTTWVTGTTAPFGKTVALTATSGYFCTVLCAQPWATTLFFRCGGVTYTLVRGGGGAGWSQCQSFNIGQLIANPDTTTNQDLYIPGTGPVPIGIALSTANFQITSTVACNPPPCNACTGGFYSTPQVTCSTTGTFTSIWYSGYNLQAPPVTLVSCPPSLLLTFTMPATQALSCSGGEIPGSTNYTITFPFSGPGTIAES